MRRFGTRCRARSRPSRSPAQRCGAGLQLAIACDFRVAADDTELSVMEVRWGILPDLGGTQRLPRLIGLGRAKELAMTARRVGADEALHMGLVNKVVAAGTHLQ